MKPIPVILDCDPGVDDAIAFLLAKQLPQLKRPRHHQCGGQCLLGTHKL